MKHFNFKSILTLILLIVTCLAAKSQTQTQYIEYVYDQAGNRTARRIIIKTDSPSNVKRNPNTTDSTLVKDVFGEQMIVIYPNPTQGMLGVEITGGKAEEKLTIAIFNGQGAVLATMEAKDGINYIDFTNYVNGWYILSVQTGTKRKEYKIIKQ